MTRGRLNGVIRFETHPEHVEIGQSMKQQTKMTTGREQQIRHCQSFDSLQILLPSGALSQILAAIHNDPPLACSPSEKLGNCVYNI
jgi:hypothetical protein